MKAEIESFGYKMWKEENEKSFHTRLYQKRVDTLPGWEDVPLCRCNDKLFIDLEELTFIYGSDSLNTTFSVKIRAEGENEIWCDLGFYSVTCNKLPDIPFMEKKLKSMWLEFNREENM